MGGALGLALLVSLALSGTTTGTAVFHRSVLAAAIFAAASAIVAIALLRPAERSLPTRSADNEQASNDGADPQLHESADPRSHERVAA